MDFASLWEAIADRFGENIALSHEGTRRTWREYDDRAARLASVYAKAGLGEGSRVAIFMQNRNEYLEAQYAAFKIRGIPINVNYRYLDEELVYLFNDAKADAVVFEADFADRVAKVAPKLPRIKLLLQVDKGGEVPGVLDFEQAIAGAEPAPRIGHDDQDIYMLYTGGTTGMPKGVMYRQGSFIAGLLRSFEFRGMTKPTTIPEVLDSIAQLREMGESAVGLTACPLMHGTGMWVGAMMPLNMGGTAVTVRNRPFDAHKLWQAVERERVTDMAIVGDPFARPMLLALEEAQAKGKPYDISSVKRIMSSGAMWSKEVKDGLLRFGDMTLIDAMGATEGGMAFQMTTRDYSPPTGTFMPGPGTKVLNDNDEEVKPGSGEIGKIAISESIPEGYYGDEKKTAATFRDIGGVRFCFPGDFAKVEADGSVTLLGRGSFCINTAGEKVFPEEVEEVLKRHPAVEDALVVGVPDERTGERVTAVVSLKPGAHATPEEIIEFGKAHLAHYKLPRQLVISPVVQRAPNGKADYRWAKTYVQEHLAA